MAVASEGVGARAARRSFSLGPTAPAFPILAVGTLLATRLVLGLLGDGLVGPGDLSPGDVAVILAAAAATTTLPAAIVFTIMAQHEDRIANLTLAASALLLSVTVFGFGDLGMVVMSGTNVAPLETVRTWGLLAAFGLATLGLWNSNFGFRGAWPLAIPLAVIGGVLVVGVPVRHAGSLGLAVIGWAALVIAYGLAYLRSRRSRELWLAISYFGFFLAASGPNLGPEAAGAVRTMAGLILIVGLVGAVEKANWRGTITLEKARREMSELREAAQAAQQRQEERDHAARSALAAIEFTAHALRKAGSVDPGAFEQLERAMLSELALLRRLVTLPDPLTESIRYRLSQAVDGVVQAERALGLEVATDVPHELVGVGTPDAVAQLVQILLENARRHAAGSPVWVRARACGPWLIVRVDDAGPGIPEHRWRDVFRRGGDGGHPTSGQGRGLGLFIADRLVREQRGHIWVAAAAGGGASMRIALPAAVAHGDSETESVGDAEYIEWTRRRVALNES